MTTVAVTMYLLHSTALWCGPAITEATPPWVAMPAAWYTDGGQCGDTIGIKADGELRYFVALDRISLGAWYVVQPTGEYLPIAADVPEPWVWFDGLSTVAEDVWRVEDLRDRWEVFR